MRHVHGFYFTGRGGIEEFVQAFTVLVKTGRFILVRVGRCTIGLSEFVELGLNSRARAVAGSGVVGGSRVSGVLRPRSLSNSSSS